MQDEKTELMSSQDLRTEVRPMEVKDLKLMEVRPMGVKGVKLMEVKHVKLMEVYKKDGHQLTNQPTMNTEIISGI